MVVLLTGMVLIFAIYLSHVFRNSKGLLYRHVEVFLLIWFTWFFLCFCIDYKYRTQSEKAKLYSILGVDWGSWPDTKEAREDTGVISVWVLDSETEKIEIVNVDRKYQDHIIPKEKVMLKEEIGLFGLYKGLTLDRWYGEFWLEMKP